MSVVSVPVKELSLCVIAASPEALPKAQDWAQFFACPLNPLKPEDYFFHFHVEESRVYVRDREKRLLEIDFDENHLDYERKGHRGKNELVAKALGVAKGHRRILDLSVGLGIDSVFLTQLGFSVTGVERSPVLYALLKEAFAKTDKEYLKSYKLHHADALTFLKEQKGKLEIDAIYFDPMYPHKKKSALPKQEMVVFRDLVGHDDDAAEVLKEALTWPVQRVVVKRPIHAEELLPGVRHAYEGKVVRYDTYVVG
ncbi:class I SAM-dependent methyltransferase [Bdellovibrio reynosensis]|uniref:Ribosomal RNA small subunit methyltransferase J n=1 Tax=Bdellovibrio reynosensis TaxID=2835041 RepID=A0ABY4C4N2_9BACT|nr:class I SAM-dependent methyltransferase [Bdellovibrio reynosensis]UOE99901.1 class I SAM-dependent methyltransferase [Bdellovibrio reynosensis]